VFCIVSRDKTLQQRSVGGSLQTLQSRTPRALSYSLTHLLLSAGLVALLLLLGVADDREGRRDLAGLDGGEGVAEVLGELLDERRVKGVGLVLGNDSSDDVGRELVEALLVGGLGGEDGLEGVGCWVSDADRTRS
jgi:hypothetical protein